jgi:hypothetical protein
VRNLGYVSLVEARGSTRVWLRPLLVAEATAAALIDRVASYPCQRYVISYLDGAWQHEICGRRDAAVRSLAAHLGDCAPGELPEPFMATRRSIQAILSSHRDPLSPLLNLWMDGAYPDDLPGLLRRLGLYDRAMIVEREPTGGRFVFRHSGQGIELYDSAWPRAAVGRRVEDQPDRAYGRWIAAACTDIDAHQVPRYELVHAMIGGPDGPRQTWRYERLMVPWRVQSKRMVVSITRPSHDRRRMIPG